MTTCLDSRAQRDERDRRANAHREIRRDIAIPRRRRRWKRCSNAGIRGRIEHGPLTAFGCRTDSGRNQSYDYERRARGSYYRRRLNDVLYHRRSPLLLPTLLNLIVRRIHTSVTKSLTQPDTVEVPSIFALSMEYNHAGPPSNLSYFRRLGVIGCRPGCAR